jgi:hypothetical protein
MVAALTFGALLPAVRAQTEHEEQLEPSACRLSGSVTVSPKIACPLDLLDVTLYVDLQCPAGQQAPWVRWLRVVHVLPEAVLPAGNGTDPAPALDRTFQSPAQAVTITHQVRATMPGTFTLGGAEVTLEDDAGRHATARLEPATVVVSGHCPGRAPVYLPLVYRPTCVPQAAPADVVLVVDRSSSVGDEGLKEAAAHVRGVLDALDLGRDRIGLVAFDQRASLVAPLGSSRAAVEVALSGLVAAAGTRLERGLRTGAAELGSARSLPGRRRVMVLVTDGIQVGPGDDSVVLTAAAEVRAQGITIFSLALGPHPDQELLTAISGDARRSLQTGSKDDPAAAYRALADAAACTR